MSNSIRISLKAPPEIEGDKIQVANMAKNFKIVLAKDQQVNFTCEAEVGCYDINYEIKFVTNISVSIKFFFP